MTPLLPTKPHHAALPPPQSPRGGHHPNMSPPPLIAPHAFGCKEPKPICTKRGLTGACKGVQGWLPPQAQADPGAPGGLEEFTLQSGLCFPGGGSLHAALDSQSNQCPQGDSFPLESSSLVLPLARLGLVLSLHCG